MTYNQITRKEPPMTNRTRVVEAILLTLILAASYLSVLAAGIYGTPDWRF